jgi:transcriptional regulator with XRE-family HTH domain
MTQEVESLLERLAEKLGVTTQYLWDILLKQAPISAATNIFLGLVLGVIMYSWFKATVFFHRKIVDDPYWDDINYLWIAAVWTVLLAVAGYFLFYIIPDTIYALVHPEYWALKQIFHVVGRGD